jgi:DNA-directed RNA polymerase subunit M/transcription elongation factor TFIIS
MSAEEDFDLISDSESVADNTLLDEVDEVDDLDEEDDLDEDDDLDDDELDEEDLDEETEVEEEEAEEAEVEVEEEEEEEVPEEEEEVEEEDDELSFRDLYSDEDAGKSTKKQKMRIERYCKSMNETYPREKTDKNCLPSETFSVLKNLTTEKNSIAFSQYIKTKRDLFELCGKLYTKEIGNKEVFQELKSGVKNWDSMIYNPQKKQEEMEIRILTTKMDVVEGLYQCRRCGSQKTYSRQVQTRSADEGMTSIIQCSKCSLVWREYA